MPADSAAITLIFENDLASLEVHLHAQNEDAVLKQARVIMSTDRHINTDRRL